MENAKAHTSVPAPRARRRRRRANDQVCLRHELGAQSRRQAAMGCIDECDEAIRVWIKGRRGSPRCRHEATRSRDHLGVHWTWGLGMEARAACAGKIHVQVRGVQLTAVAGARSSAAAEVAGIHDCWLVWGWVLVFECE